ncbi:MAG TPA: hypothetical protein VF134_00855 [Candidatus Dormibacteraeota bacterium]
MRAYTGLALALLATVGLLAVRIAAGPTGAGIRHAMAAAPDRGLYYAAPGSLLLVRPEGGVRLLATTLGPGTPLALAADSDFLVLGTTAGVEQSSDGGRTWGAAPVAAGHYPAVFVSGSTALAGEWGGAIWTTTDRGSSWRRTAALRGEYQALTALHGEWFAATLTGLLRSPDRGASWETTGTPPRVMALQPAGDQVLAATWPGQIFSIGAIGDPKLVTDLHVGVWTLAAGLAATTDGVRDSGAVALAGREVSALVDSDGILYAGVAGGPVELSTDGGRTWTQLKVKSSTATVT